ncbi:MAG: hypothetical protein JSV88_33605 [Candidatus Aminicenantes bacterium]|nr:MAG: hypothetical protein JSV88_33605 [Candidatus Aminicenantes bacterium]
MKKLLLSLAIILLIGVIVSIFVPGKVEALDPDPKENNPRDPHFHVGDWTVCCNELNRACDS